MFSLDRRGFGGLISVFRASRVALMVKNPLANVGDTRDWGLIPGSGRSPGGGHGNPLQYSCLENPMDRGAWRATVHRVAKNWTPLSTHTSLCLTSSGLLWGRERDLFPLPSGPKGQKEDHLAGNTRWVVGETFGPRIGVAVMWGHELSL